MQRLSLRTGVECTGIGLFTARPAAVRLLPGSGAGVRIRRADGGVPEAARAWFDARVQNLQQMPGLPGRNTVLGVGGPLAITTEHILSALVGMGITDCDIELESPEFPMFDGSASAFVEAIESAGVHTLPGTIQPLRIKEPVTVSQGPATIIATPRADAGCSYSYTLDYGGTPGAEGFGVQVATWSGDAAGYKSQVAAARTFCLVPEALALRQGGLFQHVSPKEMLVLDADGKPVENELRFSDEPARHKLLDLIGDLALVGRPIQADIVARRAGHALNHSMARALLSAGEVRG